MRLNRELCLAELHAALQPGPWRAGGPIGGGDGLGAEGHDIRILDAFAASGALAVPASRSETRAPSHAPEVSATATLLQGRGPLRPQDLSGSPCLAVRHEAWDGTSQPSHRHCNRSCRCGLRSRWRPGTIVASRCACSAYVVRSRVLPQGAGSAAPSPCTVPRLLPAPCTVPRAPSLQGDRRGHRTALLRAGCAQRHAQQAARAAAAHQPAGRR